MDQGTLVRDDIEAGAWFVERFEKYAPIKVAFWLKGGDDHPRYLYVSSDQIDETNFDLAYGEVGRLTQMEDAPYLDPFRVKIAYGKSALAVDVAEINRKYPDKRGIRFGPRTLGGKFANDGYIYPNPISELSLPRWRSAG